MPMSRNQKSDHLAELEATLGEAKGIAFAFYQGLKVAHMQKMRDDLARDAMTVRVTKNTLLHLALKNRGISFDEAILTKPLVLVASRTDEVGPAKALATLSKDFEALAIAGGVMNDTYLEATQMKALATLPSRDQLRAQLVGVLAAPLTGLVRTIQAPLSGLVSVLHQYQQSKA